MNAIGFLEGILAEGWSSERVMVVRASGYNTASEFCEQMAGGKNLCTRNGFTYNSSSTFALIWLSVEMSEYNRWANQADMIAENGEEMVLFFEIDSVQDRCKNV